MTGFVILAGLLALLAVLFVIRPLLRARAGTPPAASTAMIAVLAVIVTSVILYSLLGNPAALRSAATAAAPRVDIGELARHVQLAPDDQRAWLALGQAYGESGQYVLALHAYQQADTLAGGRDANALAGMGESLLLQGDRSQVPQASADFERALQLDPRSPKGLFYGAVLAYQSGRLSVARERFATMLALTPAPPENVRLALQRQIQAIDAQLHPRVDAATAIQLRVTLAPALSAKIPPNASLFVFVRAADGGPPLAVKRTSAELPQEVQLSAADAMIAQRALQPGQRVTVVARISASGNALAASGDLYGQIQYVAGKTGLRSLEIDTLSH